MSWFKGSQPQDLPYYPGEFVPLAGTVYDIHMIIISRGQKHEPVVTSTTQLLRVVNQTPQACVIEIKVGEYRVSLGAGSIIYANNAIIAQVLVMPNLRVGMILFDASGNLRMKVLEVQQEDPSANEPTVLEFPIEIGKDYDVDYVSVSGQRLTKYDKLLAIIKPFRQGAIELASQLSMDIRDQMGRVEYLGGETFNEGLPYLRCHLLARDGSAWLGALFGERRSLKLRFTTRIEGEQYGSWG